MTPLEQFDREEQARFEIIRNSLPHDMSHSIPADFLKSHDARRDAMMREELLGRMPKDKNIASGEGLPFENSPEIYGNERMVAYARGYNEGKAEITSIINDVLS